VDQQQKQWLSHVRAAKGAHHSTTCLTLSTKALCKSFQGFRRVWAHAGSESQCAPLHDLLGVIDQVPV